jgi:glycosyltransferase involved in cell wall biosynthesis
MMRLAIFLSHPIQHFSPLWQELARRPEVRLKVFYYSRQGIEKGMDREFGVEKVWDVDLLSGYEHEFLSRQWPTRDSLDCSGKALNRGMARALTEGADVAYVSGYAHLNNWAVVHQCQRFGIPLLYQSDSNFLAERRRPAWRWWLKRQIIRPFFRRVTVFLACGDHNRTYLEYYGAPSDRIRFSAIPVDTNRFRCTASELNEAERRALRAKYGLAVNDFVAGFSGKLVARKRPQDLLQAVILANRPSLRAFYIGTGRMEGELKARGGPARFAGFVNQSQMPKVLSLCDVLVMPSDYDPHPLIVTEAQCLGIPVILSDHCGCYGPSDVFRDQESGLLYPCSNVRSLAEALVRLIDRPSERARMGKRAQDLSELQSVRTTADDFLAAAALAVRSKRAALL